MLHSALWQRLGRRLAPLIAVTGLIVIGVGVTVWLDPYLFSHRAWTLPDDLWGTLVAASRLLHGDLAGLYTRPTALITLPGGALILVPAVVLIDAAGFSLHLQSAHNAQPGAWLLAGPYEIAISGIALFAADAIAERAGAERDKRALLAAAGAAALWSVSVRWGHPEDAVAVGLLLYAVLAQANGKLSRAAWLTGAAIAVQPLVVLAFPVLLAVLPARRLTGFLLRAAAPGALLLAVAAAANWNATYVAVFEQPNWPSVNEPTPWLAVATRLPDGAVAAGPVRLLAISAACACAVGAARQCRAACQAGRWDATTLLRIVWWIGLALALRSLFEPVMVAYYLWPVLELTLIAAITTWPRLTTTIVAAVALTFASQGSWRSPWLWWLPLVAGLAVILTLARVSRQGQTIISQESPAWLLPATAAVPPPPDAGHQPSR
jgi:hypothetical protein